jgi:hypothetical protein
VVTITLPEQQSDVKKLMKAAGVDVSFERVTASSPLVAKLVGNVADKIDPRTRAALLTAKNQQGGGQSTGANAERKRSNRSGAAPAAGGRGGRGGRGRVSAAPAEGGNRQDRRKDQAQAPRFGSEGRRPARADGDVARGPKRAPQGSEHRNDAAGSRAAGSGQSRPARAQGSAAVWSSTTGGTSGGSFGGASGGSGRPARSGGPRRASAPASNQRRSR